MPTASVMVTESEVFGSCVGEIDVSVGMENRGVLLCCGWNYLGFILERKMAQDMVMVPGIGWRFRCFGLD